MNRYDVLGLLFIIGAASGLIFGAAPAGVWGCLISAQISWFRADWGRVHDN